jgi:hypothetical protein
MALPMERPHLAQGRQVCGPLARAPRRGEGVSKGHWRRPSQVSDEEYTENFERTFGRKVKSKSELKRLRAQKAVEETEEDD